MTRFLANIWDFICTHPVRFMIRVLFFTSVLFFIFGDFGLVTRIVMEVENRSLEHRQAAEQKKIVALRNTIRNAYLPDSVERVARERYNFRRKGESVFMIREQ
ncbi:MAG: septum formation initiator family protein [Chlorobiaceae bacterium]|nr:septum formation initiator family protein [Chlorobiaceae bacterium]